MSMLMVAEAFCDYLPHGTEVFDDDALDAAVVIARNAWIEALGFMPAEREELVRQEDARQSAAMAAYHARTPQERRAASIATAKAIRQRMSDLLADCEPASP